MNNLRFVKKTAPMNDSYEAHQYDQDNSAYG